MRGILVFGAVLLAGVTTTAAAQDRSWQNKWYWGTQGGVHAFTLGGGQLAATAGGHWLITAGRSALYVAYDKQFMPTLTQTIGTGQTATFDSGQRFQAIVYAVPNDNKLQVMLGGGFAISRITGAQLTGAFTTVLDGLDLDDASTKALLVLSAGWQYRPGQRWAIFGQYQFMPGSRDFVIRSAQHSFNLGIRFAVTHSEEVVSTER
jgi:hypothetical protein